MRFDYFFKKKPPSNDIQVFRLNGNPPRNHIYLNGQYAVLNGIVPLVDENCEITPFVCIGNKNGMSPFYKKFRSTYGNRFKYIFRCMNGPYFKRNYKKIYRDFDGVFNLDFKPIESRKSLYCNHTMIYRSLPNDDFYWESEKQTKIFDYSILTWGYCDKEAKRWDRIAKIIPTLAKNNLKGIVVTQKDTPEKLIKKAPGFKKIVEEGKLTILPGKMSGIEFNRLMDQSRISIFPNQWDAFPRVMIESLLSDRRIIISKDLMMGKEILSNLGEESCLVLDFDDIEASSQKIVTYLKRPPAPYSIRSQWIEKYSFWPLIHQWAKEFNRVFGTNYKCLYYFGYEEQYLRLKKRYEKNI